LESALASVSDKRDANIDSGCSITMTPYKGDVDLPRLDNTPIRLADHSQVIATHKGTVSLPINSDAQVPALVVPDLHEPLLSVAGICDQQLTVVFNSSACEILKSSNVHLDGTPIGRG
jgi:hypothetical protein